jgi:DNA-binding MarR family transcriptional regulator
MRDNIELSEHERAWDNLITEPLHQDTCSPNCVPCNEDDKSVTGRCAMRDHIELNEHERAWENLAVTYMTLERARELELGKVGLTIPQAGVLYFLKTSKEPLTPMKLSRRMNRQPHTISALLTRMEAQGLVKTTKDLARKNWVRVSLTRKGDEAFKRQMNEKTARNATSCLSKKEIDALNTICKRLRAKGAELIRQMQPGPYSDSLFQ